MLVFACFFFIIAVFEILFILAGQGADAPIKAFTDTDDWTFSQQLPPPPLEYKGHYLCTVTASSDGVEWALSVYGGSRRS